MRSSLYRKKGEWTLVNFELPVEKLRLLKKYARKNSVPYASLLRLAVDKIIEENSK